MRTGAVAARRIIVFARVGLDLINELPHRFHIDDVRIDAEHVRHVDQGRDGRKIRLDIEWQLAVERCVDAVGSGGAEQNGVAIGARPRHILRPDIAACASAVVGNDAGV